MNESNRGPIVPVIDGWRESLLIVADIDHWIRTYQALGDWDVRYEGDVTPDVIAFLGLPNGARATEALLVRASAEYGFVRLMQIAAEFQAPLIRPDGKPANCGGWFDLNARVDDLAGRVAQLQAMGWQGLCEPVEYDFGANTVKEWVAGGPDGVFWALIERLQPPLAPEMQPGSFGPHFNSTQIVANFAAARRFYEVVLGFSIVAHLDDQPVMVRPGQNVIGLPHDVAAGQKWSVAMMQPPGRMGGAVEIITLPGLPGQDFSAHADPPNRGIVSLRFPTDDLAALHAHLVASGISIVRSPQQVSIPPCGEVTMMTVRGPCGARLDFFQSG